MQKRAQTELHRRQKARQSLIAFTEYTFPRYRTAAVHRQIAEQLERVERGESDRLMLLVAPRHGKSELASKRYPPMALGRDPTLQFVSVAATAEFASDWGRDVRNIIAGQEYRALFQTKLAEDSKAKGKWHTSAGGVYYAVGVGGVLMGKGADRLVIDDPFSSMEDAQSETTRKNVWDWYTGTAYNRLMPGGRIVLINHRMHEDDLSGRLLAQQAAGGDRWDVVELKATPDAPLWPEAYDEAALRRMKANTQPRFWSALYEQNPIPDEGTYFKREWLRYYGQRPAHLLVYGASDYAVTEDGGDYTVHLVIGVDPEDNIYILDVWRQKTESDVWADAFCELVKRWKPLQWAEENGQIQKSVGPFLTKRQIETKAWTMREQFASASDKPTRAQSIRGRMAMGKIYLPSSADWLADFVNELMSFPLGRNDDQVDCLSLIGRMLDKMAKGHKPEEPASNVIRGFPNITFDELLKSQHTKERRV